MAVSLVKAWTREEVAALVRPLLNIGAAFDIALPETGNIRRLHYNGGAFIDIHWANGGVSQWSQAALEAA